jgi:hypothetical protein
MLRRRSCPARPETTRRASGAAQLTACRIPVLISARCDDGRVGRGRRVPARGGRELPGCQERGGARPLSGPQARRVVPARHAGDVRAGLAGRQPSREPPAARLRDRPGDGRAARGPAGCGQLPGPRRWRGQLVTPAATATGPPTTAPLPAAAGTTSLTAAALPGGGLPGGVAHGAAIRPAAARAGRRPHGNGPPG